MQNRAFLSVVQEIHLYPIGKFWWQAPKTPPCWIFIVQFSQLSGFFSVSQFFFCFFAAAARTRQPTRRELYRWWSTAEPGARLFRAKYVYRPLRDSPNDNPETELSLTPGDYLLIFGDLDEDFYYRGELWTGERGLVPSNYVEPVTGGVLGVDSVTPVIDSSSLLMIAQQQRTTPASTAKLLNRAASERSPAGMGPGPLVSAATMAALRSAKSVDVFTTASGLDAQQQQQHPASAVLSALSTLCKRNRHFLFLFFHSNHDERFLLVSSGGRVRTERCVLSVSGG